MGIPWFFPFLLFSFPMLYEYRCHQIDSPWSFYYLNRRIARIFGFFFHYWPVICECHRAQQQSTSEQEEGCQEKSMAQVDSFITRRVKSTGSMFRKRKKYAKWNANLCLLTQRIFVIIFSIKQVVSGLLLLAIQTHGSYNLRAKFYHPIELLCTSSSRAR